VSFSLRLRPFSLTVHQCPIQTYLPLRWVVSRLINCLERKKGRQFEITVDGMAGSATHLVGATVSFSSGLRPGLTASACWCFKHNGEPTFLSTIFANNLDLLTHTLNSMEIPVMKPSTWPIGSLVAFSHTAGVPLRAWTLPTSILPYTSIFFSLVWKNVSHQYPQHNWGTGSAPSPMLCYRHFHLGCLLAFSHCQPPWDA